MPSTKMVLAAASAFLATTNAHMIMKTPTPFGKSSLNNSPLDASGSDFPCKQRQGVYSAEGASNTMPIGVNQTLSFTGSAVHGGGSCQISLTTDKAPSTSTKWQVIHSIEGGCPANAAGNLPEDPNGSGASEFQFSVPEGIAAGDYVLAWTWFNHLGNREMYMNCAPVTVTGGSGKRDVPAFTERDSSFPDMFKANIGNGCTTADSADLKFPNPGDSVQYAGSSTLTPPVGTCDAAVAPSGGDASSSSGGTPSSAAASPAASSAGGQFAQSPTASPTAPTFTIVASPMPTASTPAAAAPSAAAPSGNANSSTGTTGSSSSSSSGSSAPALPGSSACTTPGQEVCSSDNTQIGMCDETNHVVFQPVAAGTICSNGQMVAKPMAKRNVGRYARGHVRRHHSGYLAGRNW